MQVASKTNRFRLVMALTLWSAVTAHAQIKVSGVLLRSDTGGPFAHATVHAAPSVLTLAAPPSGYRVQTALDGSFAFDSLPPGSYRFCVHNSRRLGFR